MLHSTSSAISCCRAASQQYGGFTVPSVDLLLEPYAERSYKMLTEKYSRLGLDAETVEKEVMADILNDFEQGFQGWEYKFNTVASSRGDYPFITMTMGTGTAALQSWLPSPC